jgi:mono/diheme cytochrome c family protein
MMRIRPFPCSDDRALWKPLSTLALSLAAVVLLGMSASAEELRSANPSLSSGWVFSEQGGAALYANVCAACHQPDGMGAIGAGAYPSLAGNEKLASAGYLETVLLHGLRGMPAVGRMMSDVQAADVINYVRTHFGNKYDDAVSAADIKAAR